MFPDNKIIDLFSIYNNLSKVFLIKLLNKNAISNCDSSTKGAWVACLTGGLTLHSPPPPPGKRAALAQTISNGGITALCRHA